MQADKLILVTEGSKDYELIDSGFGEKLERFGPMLVSRPDPQALWKKNLPAGEWSKASARFAGGKIIAGEKTKKAEQDGKTKKTGTESGWSIASSAPKSWPIEFAGRKFLIKPSAFKHVGLFPEQSPQWQWVSDMVAGRRVISPSSPITILNLFAYTGGATLAAAAAGGSVTHVDASRPAVTWAKENADLSGLAGKPIRWIVDDVPAFVQREIRRGNHYDAVIMDPPAFGRGPKGEVWKIEDELPNLLDACQKILSSKPLFFLLNGYASGYSAVAYEQCLASIVGAKTAGGASAGIIEAGELAIRESSAGRLLPAGIFARWSAFPKNKL